MRTQTPKHPSSFTSEMEAAHSKSKKSTQNHFLVIPKRITLFLTFLLLLLNLSAQIPAGYYNTATGAGDVLRANLRDIITAGHVKLPYTSTAFDVWDAYSHTDVRPSPNNTIVWDMYSDIPSGSPVYTYTIYTDQCGSASQEGDCFSREHLLPNSWWGTFDNASNPQYSDLHHLFPADQYVNNKKSNYIVAETTDPTWTSSNGSKVGPCSITGFTGTIFEPINEYKGDFARAFLYLATRYMNTMSIWRNTYTYDSQYIIAASGGNYLQWYIDMLVRWHNQDPVSTKEIARNDSIYYATPQHNRNPYIDHPEYVCLVWTSTNCVSGPIITNTANNPVYPGPSNTVSVTADITDDGNITSAILQWCTDGTSFGNSITMALNGAPSYITSSLIPAQTAGTSVTYKILATDNEANSTTSATCSYTVLQPEPANHPTSFNCGTTTSSSISLSWTDAIGTVIPDGYLIKASIVSLAAIADPGDGTPEVDGSFVKNISSGTQSVSFSGLAPSTTYFFKIFPYTNSSVNINYKTSPAALTANCTTSTGGSGSGCATDLIISEYVEGSGNNKYIEIYNGTGASVNLSDYRLRLFPNGTTTPTTDKLLSGTLADQAVKVYSNSAAIIFTTDTIITTATFFNGDDALGLYKISTASYVDIFGRIGQDPGTAWISGTFTTLNSTLIRNSTVTSGVTINPASGFPTLATEWTQSGIDVATFLGGHMMECGTSCASPTVPSGNLSFSAITETGMTISWVNGDGAARMVVVKRGSPVTGGPVAGTTYVANAAFGAGNTLNSGEYIVYNSTGNNVAITNLSAGQRYFVSIFEYNCTAGSELYLTPGISTSQVTYSLITAATPESQYCITSTNGFITSIDFTSTGTFTSNNYTAQLSDASGSFNTPVSIGTFSSNANSGTINCTIPANTASGAAYRIRIISSNPAIIGTISNAFEIALYSPCVLPTAAFSNRNNFCMDDGGTISLSVSGGSGTTLVWTAGSCSGALVGTGNPLIVDSPADTITYFAHWENSCSLTSCTSITITPVPDVTSFFNQLGPYCVGVLPEALSVTSLNGITGTWSPASISTASAGSTVYSFTPTAGQCAITAIMNVTIKPMPVAEAGIDSSYTGTPILIGDPANGPGTITWSPVTGLNNPNIAQPLASPAVTTIYTVTIDNNGCIATDAVTISVGGVGQTISGKTRYAGRANAGIPAPNFPTYNSVNYSIDNVIVILNNYPAGTEVARDTSDALGQYQFSNIMNGNYMLSYVKYAADTMQWCNDVNAADVAMLMYFIASDTLFDPSRCFSAKYKKAADVDDNSFINAIDVARLKSKIGSPYNTSKNFPHGNWEAINTLIAVEGSDLIINLETICNGDYNASSIKYRDSLTTWAGAKTLPTDIIGTSEEYITITDPGYFEVPLRISSKMNEFSALGLELTYPNGYKLANAFMPRAINKGNGVKINPALEEVITGNNDLLVTDEAGVIRIVYATTNHFDVAANDEIIVLGFRALNKLDDGYLEFELSGTGIIANQYGEENDKVHLLMPKVFVSGNDNDAEFEFAGYPNPFSGEATITYNLPENGIVKLNVYNAFGELVIELVDEAQDSGKHSVVVSSTNLPAGMYSLKLDFTGLSQSKCMVLRLVH